jgi:hypothetical protein
LDSGRAFFFSGGALLAQMGGPTPFKEALPSAWIDSDIALAVAEAGGGAVYRTLQQNVWVDASLVRGLYPWDASRATWLVHYTSSTAQDLSIWVDALTGQLLTGVEDERQGGVAEFALLQNFPNPCNPVTTIAYHVKEKCKVRLEVLDPLGRTVSLVLDEERLPGEHHAVFEARDLPSGVYLYRITMRDFQAVRKLVVLK